MSACPGKSGRTHGCAPTMKTPLKEEYLQMSKKPQYDPEEIRYPEQKIV